MQLRWCVVVAVLWLGSSVAYADDLSEELSGKLAELPYGPRDTSKPPRFAFSNKAAFIAPRKLMEAAPRWLDSPLPRDSEVGISADRKTAWIAADLQEVHIVIACGAAPCPPEPPPQPTEPARVYHATALLEKVGDDWQWVAWHITEPVSADDQQAAREAGTVPREIPRSIAGAEDVVKLFESTIGDPKALAKTVSSSESVVLYGSELKERYDGGATVRKQLERWGLAFKVRDGIQAGVVTAKNVAYVAANVDAVPQKKPKAKPSPYRLLFVYEKTAAGWQLVQAHFSVVP